MNNYIKNRNREKESPLLYFLYKNKQYKVEFLNTGCDSFKGTGKKNSRIPIQNQHSHSVFHFLLFSEGNYHYLHNGKRINFSPGTFTITSPNEPHRFGPFYCSNNSSYYFLTFALIEIDSEIPLDIDFIKFMKIYTEEKIPEIPFPLHFNKRQISIFENLTMILTEQLNSTEKFNSFSAAKTMIDIIDFILYECCTVTSAGEEKHDNYCINKAKQFIEKNFSQTISISQLSSIAALEPSYFIRKFKKTYQTTPISYQMELKINASKTLLKTTDFRISDIAEQVGFNDIYYFSRFFKKSIGMPPGKFRQK